MSVAGTATSEQHLKKRKNVFRVLCDISLAEPERTF